MLKNHPEVLAEPLTGNLSFHTLSGELIVDISSKDGSIFMDFTADPTCKEQMTTTILEVAEALGLSSETIVNVEFSKLNGYAVVEIDQSVDMASLPVDSGKLVCQFKMSLTVGPIISREYASGHHFYLRKWHIAVSCVCISSRCP